LKPSNVFLTRKGRIKVLDFGVARAFNAETASPDDSVPPERELGGFTPAYASIEMLCGEPPVPADDVFALAILAYELLTGRHPFNHAAVDADQLHRFSTKELKGLRWSQKKALARAISATRDLRHEDAGGFLKQFDGSDAVRARVVTSVLVIPLLVLLGVVVFRDDATRPATPFESLPAAVQQQFDTLIREGETAMRFGDAGVNDALSYFSTAYELHPNNPRAIDGLEAVADRFLGSIGTADPATQRQVFELLYCHDYLTRYDPVAAACAGALGPDCEAIVRACVSAEDR
jgi:serine/threonine protein kinase